MNFDTFSFHPQINAGINAAGYSTPTPIQSQTIPSVLEGRDVLGLAQTGTGKTAAFVLPILQRLMKGQRGAPRALILSPTRELSEQTHVVIKALGRQTGLRSVTLYGGVSPIPQIRELRAGVDFIVACPGRLLDLMGQKVVNLSGIQVVVLDEADQMFDMGFLPAIRRILAALPAQRQTLLFSATMPDEIRSLATDMLKHPVTVEISPSRPVESVRQVLYPVEQERKYAMLMNLLSQTGDGQVLVFTRTKHRAKKLGQQLSREGISATSLQGNLSQNRRQEAMDDFRKGRVQVMVATDIAARGIDVSQVSHVINYDMPDTADAYTHRIGRTGRMEKLGYAFTLTTQDDLPMVRAIERVIGRSIELRKVEGFDYTVSPAARPAQSAPRPNVVQEDRPMNRPGGRPGDRSANRPADRSSQRDADRTPNRSDSYRSQGRNPNRQRSFANAGSDR